MVHKEAEQVLDKSVSFRGQDQTKVDRICQKVSHMNESSILGCSQIGVDEKEVEFFIEVRELLASPRHVEAAFKIYIRSFPSCQDESRRSSH